MAGDLQGHANDRPGWHCHHEGHFLKNYSPKAAASWEFSFQANFQESQPSIYGRDVITLVGIIRVIRTIHHHRWPKEVPK
jgi:hypothetical protein